MKPWLLSRNLSGPCLGCVIQLPRLSERRAFDFAEDQRRVVAVRVEWGARLKRSTESKFIPRMKSWLSPDHVERFDRLKAVLGPLFVRRIRFFGLPFQHAGEIFL